MDFVIVAFVLLLVIFFAKGFSYRSKCINVAVEALKQTVNFLPDESTPSPRVIKSKLSMKYYELSLRVASKDISDYAKNLLGRSEPEQVAMLLLFSLSDDFKQESQLAKMTELMDIAIWCENAADYLADKEKYN